MKNFTINWSSKYSVVSFSGELSISDIDKASTEQSNNERYYEHKYTLWDFRESDLSKIDKEELVSVIAFDIGASFTLQKFKVGIIATDPYAVSLCEVYVSESEKSGSEWAFKIFDNIESANKWASA